MYVLDTWHSTVRIYSLIYDVIMD